jgi:xanthine dehydrogenase accessory factor
MQTGTLNRLLQDRQAKTAVALATDLATGAQALVYRDGAEGPLAENAEVVAAARQAMVDDRSRTAEIANGEVFIQVFNPPLRMVIVGAVHIAQPLSRMASVAGYDVTVVDPRGAFATEDRFPGINRVVEWPDDALEQLDLDRRTAVVTLTHDPKIDDPALHVALKSDAFYIGALGSRRTHGTRVERLREAGFTDGQIGRIHGPVGLNIGAVSPAEIAVSILGEVTGALHEKETKAAA